MKHERCRICNAPILIYTESILSSSAAQDFPRAADGAIDFATIPMHNYRVCEQGHIAAPREIEPDAQTGFDFSDDGAEARASIHALNERILALRHEIESEMPRRLRRKPQERRDDQER